MTTDAPAVEKLSSNVMNYMIWRYLQECGYARTAKQLQYEWMGRDQSPDQMPFAHNIQQRCLVNLAQDGLLLDSMQADIKKTKRLYNFGPDHGCKFSIPAEDSRDRKARVRSASRTTAPAERVIPNGSPAEPAPKTGKGKRKSGGNDKRVNGDAMDIDSNTETVNGAQTEEPASPAPAIEAEIPRFSLLDIGESRGTNTEKQRDLASQTCYLKIASGAASEHVTWSPHHRAALLVAGKNSIKLLKIKSGDLPESDAYIPPETNIDAPSFADTFDVQAFSWTEKGSGVFTTVEHFKNDVDEDVEECRMFAFTEYGSKVVLVDQTPSTVLSLKYQPDYSDDSGLLLALALGDEHSQIKIWEYSETVYENSKRRVEPSYQLKHTKPFDGMVYAAIWTAPNRFLACGDKTVTLYEIGETDVTLVKSIPTDTTWTIMDYDALHDTVTLLDLDAQILGVVTLETEVEVASIRTRTFESDVFVTDLALQPISTHIDHEQEPELKAQPRILAIALTNAEIHLYDIRSPLTCLQKLKLPHQESSAPQKLAFSPDGFLLAAAGFESLNIWKTLESSWPRCVWRCPTDGRWTTSFGNKEQQDANGLVDGEGDAVKHELSWDADGKRLAFGLGGQVAIIRL